MVHINTTIASLGQPGQAAGTGIILTSAGEILTNNHVIQGATDIRVTIPGRSGTYMGDGDRGYPFPVRR